MEILDNTEILQAFIKRHTPKSTKRGRNQKSFFQAEDSGDENDFFILRCNTPLSDCSSISMDTFSKTSLDNGNEQDIYLEYTTSLATPLTTYSKDRRRMTLSSDDENFTYVTIDGGPSCEEGESSNYIISATPFTYRTLHSPTRQNTTQSHSPYSYETIESSYYEETVYTVDPDSDIESDSQDESVNIPTSYTSETNSLQPSEEDGTHSKNSIDLARSRRDQSLCKLELFEVVRQQPQNHMKTNNNFADSSDSDSSSLSQRIFEMKKRRKRLRQVVTRFCRTKTNWRK